MLRKKWAWIVAVTFLIAPLSVIFADVQEFDIQKTLTQFVSGRYPEVSPLSAFDPHGRSPERSFTDDAHPRIITTFQTSDLDSVDSKKQIFAYTEKAHLLQGLIWNGKGYDFVYDPNYEGKSPPHLQPANRSMCLQCHQGGAPIFPLRAWHEINEIDETFGDPHRIEKMQRLLRGKKTYFGIPVKNIDGNVLAKNVLGANRLQQAVKVCNSVCGKKLDCRFDLLRTALQNHFPSQHLNITPTADLLKGMEPRKKNLPNKYSKHWPKDEFAYPSADIGDLPTDLPAGADGKVADSYDDMLAIANKDAKSGSPSAFLTESIRAIDPTIPRKNVDGIPAYKAEEYIKDVAFECLNFTDADAKILKGYSAEQIEMALASEKMKALAKDWPLDRSKVMATFLSTFGKINSQACNCSLSKETFTETQPIPVEKIAEAHKLSDDIAELKTVRPVSRLHFQKFCGECHGPGGKSFEGFIASDYNLNSEEGFKSFVRENRSEIKKQLKKGSMPPNDAALELPEDLRKDMIQYIENFNSP